ncbi:hypothetical protein [Epibacterium ulvae]|nr:hypothetical protein [Epibacterium ulvae]
MRHAGYGTHNSAKGIALSLVPRGCFAVLALLFGFFLALSTQATFATSEISRFVGVYTGEAHLTNALGEAETRHLQVQIRDGEGSFWVKWTTGRVRQDGSLKNKSYEVEFRPSDREGIFAAAMRHNVFGHAVPLNPLKGEPYVWGRIIGDTLTVYSLFIDPDGNYDIQQYDRTLVEGGLMLDFKSHRNGMPLVSVQSFLERLQ